MKTTLPLSLAAAAMVLAAGAQSAQADPYWVDQRQYNQDRRIDEGVANGSLTPWETRQLDRGQRRVDRMEGRFLSDGVLTGRERYRLNRRQNFESRRIWRKKHN